MELQIANMRNKRKLEVEKRLKELEDKELNIKNEKLKVDLDNQMAVIRQENRFKA